MQGAFADCQVYLGAFYPPNRIARQPVTLVHGQGHLQGSKEISPGIYTGGTVTMFHLLVSRFFLT